MMLIRYNFLGSVWAYNKDTNYAVVITVYRRYPEKWINWRTRRTNF